MKKSILPILAIGALAACETPVDPITPPPDIVRHDPVPTQPDPNLATVPGASEHVIRVAILLPTSDSRPSIQGMSQSMLNAAQLAAFEAKNKKLLFITKDTKGTYEGAQIAANEAVREGAEIILGPLFADSVRGAASVTAPLDIPMISFSNDPSVAGGNVYLLSHLPETEMARVASYAYSKGYSRFATLTPETNYGERIKHSFQSEVFGLGGEVVAQETYYRSEETLMQPTQRLAQFRSRTRLIPGSSNPGTGFQAVMVPEQGQLLRALAPTLAFNGIDNRRIRFLGISDWNNPIFTREPALNGAWFAAPDPKMSARFKGNYKKTFGENPPRLASMSYDAALLAAYLAKNEPGNRFTHENLTNREGFIGADGLFRLNPDGRVERGLAILQLSPAGIKVIDPAPAQFDPYIGF